jgi:hypothetical protein
LLTIYTILRKIFFYGKAFAFYNEWSRENYQPEVGKLNLRKMITVPKHWCSLILKTCEAKYVLLGIPEDIGIRANYGRPGSSSAW